MTSNHQQDNSGYEIDTLLDNLADIIFDKWVEEMNLETSGNINSNEK